MIRFSSMLSCLDGGRQKRSDTFMASPRRAPWVGLGALLTLGFFAQPVASYPLIVVEARGAGLQPGARIDSSTSVALKPGDKLVVIAPDGRISTLRGAYQGLPVQGSAGVQNARAALGALIATRNDRANTVGAVRSGANASPLPSPWLVDISRPGERCVLEGEQPIWWRPSADSADTFTVYPVDRSWKADFEWEKGEDQMTAPALVRLDGVKMLIIRAGGQERAIRMHVVPRSIEEPLVLAAWLLEKACVQQADALLRSVAADTPPQGGGSGDASQP